jgi:hypothetical protein
MPAKKAASRRAGRFYEQALNEAERADFDAALDVEGIDEEIALLRLRLRAALADRNGDVTLMLRGVELLSRALARRYSLSDDEVDALIAAVRGVLGEFRSVNEVEVVTGA